MSLATMSDGLTNVQDERKTRLPKQRRHTQSTSERHLRQTSQVIQQTAARRCQVVDQLVDGQRLQVGVVLRNGRGAWTFHAQASQTTPGGEWHQWSCTRLATIAPAADHVCRLGYAGYAGFPGEIFHEGSANWKTT